MLMIVSSPWYGVSNYMVRAAIAALFLCLALPTNAAGDNGRRLAAEIIAVKSDAERLMSKTVSLQHQQGLIDRIRGAISILPLLARVARNDDPSLPVLDPIRVMEIRRALEAGERTVLIAALSDLAVLFPLDTTGVLPPDHRPFAQGRAKELHETYCAGCHDDPDIDTSRPAWNLFAEAKKIPLTELAARLIIGVRGDALTGLDNPLRDAEISALVSLYIGSPIPND